VRTMSETIAAYKDEWKNPELKGMAYRARHAQNLNQQFFDKFPKKKRLGVDLDHERSKVSVESQCDGNDY